MNSLEDDLRATLRRHAQDVAWGGQLPDAVGRRARARRTGNTVLAGAVAAAVVALVVGVVRPGPGHAPQPAPSPPLPPVQQVRVVPRANGDLASIDHGALVRRTPSGTVTTWITRQAMTNACSRRDCTVEGLQWSPDGSKLAITMGVVGRLTPSHFSVYVVIDGATVPERLFDCPQSMCEGTQGPTVSWSPDSASFAVSAGGGPFDGIDVIGVDGSAPTPRAVCKTCEVELAEWSPDGRWFAYATPEGVWRMPATGGPAESVYATRGEVVSLAWSPDGTRLLVETRSAVHVVDLAARPYTATTVMRMTKSEGPVVPAWSPDGTRISWFETPGAHRRYVAELWTARPDGTHPTRLLRSGCCVSDWTGGLWSPDGRYLALGLSLDRTRPPDLLVLDAERGTQVERVPGGGWAPMAWQPRP
jgi:WD40 repeat protein